MAKPIYTLAVYLYDAPVSEKFAEANPVVSRRIQIRGSQTLEQLHRAIFKAFDRWEEHMYEFHFGPGPRDYSRGRYGIPGPSGLFALVDRDEPTSDAAKTKMSSLGLEVGQSFGYLFDFGDDWYHQIDVVAIGEAEPNLKYPRVTDRTGDSPPQYMEEEDDDWEDDDE
jgi:hypothetical protein